jgi:hypothetical protein
MTRPEDLTGDNRRLFDAWVGLGMSEERATESLRESGWLPMTEEEQLAQRFQRIFPGMSDAATKTAARGRDGDGPSPSRAGGSARPVAEGGSRPVVESDEGFLARMLREAEQVTAELREISEQQKRRLGREITEDIARKWADEERQLAQRGGSCSVIELIAAASTSPILASGGRARN